LATWIYGRKLAEAQCFFLSEIPAGSHVLVVGGGTGWVISEMKKQVTDLSITFVEASHQMLNKAKAHSNEQVEFVFQDGTWQPKPDQYDVVFTAFFLDVFPQPFAESQISMLDSSLKPGGLWIYTDFQLAIGGYRKWSAWLIRIMYTFFRTFNALSACKLPEIDHSFNQNDLRIMKSKDFLQGLLTTRIYVRGTQ
ncbi:MAG: class I SAM-dependent methyltransferase, partial [Bacteroidota bacterium]